MSAIPTSTGTPSTTRPPPSYSAVPASNPQLIQPQEHMGTSTGEIHPSLLQEDSLRRAQERPPFTALILKEARGPGHKQIEGALNAILDETDSKKYAQYLINAFCDYTLIEMALQNSKLPLPSLPLIYRAAAIQQDLAFLQSKGIVSENLLTRDHAMYYESLKSKPHVLLGFYSFLVLGIFAAGKARSERITQKWGEGATHLYQFAEDREKLIEKFKGELNTYMAPLSEEQMSDVQAELQRVWEFVGDLMDVDIRDKQPLIQIA